MRDLKACALRGVVLLSEKKPGWFKEVSLETFNMFLFGNCVLGQTYGNYITGCAQLEITHGEAVLYGFASAHHQTDYPALTALWAGFITTLQEAERIISSYQGEVLGFGPESVGSQGDGRAFLPALYVQFPPETSMEKIGEAVTDVINRVRGISRVLTDLPVQTDPAR